MQIVQEPDLILIGGLVPQMWLDNTSLKSQLNDALMHSPIAQLLAHHTVQAAPIEWSGETPINFHLPHEALLANWQGQSGASEWLANQDLSDREQQDYANTWRVLPVHCRLATDHISLSNIALDALTISQAQQLVASVEPMATEYGAQLQVSEHGNWFLKWPELKFDELLPSSPFAALGRSIDVYLPRDCCDGSKARLWRRFVTECEMAWFNHPANESRLANNLLNVNSLWLLGRVAVCPRHNRQTQLNSRTPQSTALQAILSDQPFEWSVAMKDLDASIFDPVRKHLTANQPQRILLTNDQDAQILTFSRKKFWQRSHAFSIDEFALPTNPKP
jgi:hypothetical protein